MQETTANSQNLFEENESVILISDSESEGGESSASVADSEFEQISQFFGLGTDSFSKKSLVDDRLRIQSWLLSLFRKCQMVAEIYQMQKNSTNSFQPIMRANIYDSENSRQLAGILAEIKERNRRGKTSFFIFNELPRVLKDMPNSALMDPAIYSKMCYILEEFALGASLKPENFIVLKNFLGEKYRSANNTLKSIFVKWKSSTDYNSDLEYAMLYERKFLYGLLYGSTMNQLDFMIGQNAALLPTIVEIGSFSVSNFKNFLTTFNISFSGPYKKTDPNGLPKIIFYVTSLTSGDSIVNGGMPLYGCYEFKVSALNEHCKDAALKIVSSLEFPPYWLSVIPPIFNETLNNLQRQLLLQTNQCL